MKRVFYLLLIVICVFSITKGYSQQFKVINGTISLTNAAGTTLTNKTVRGTKVIVNYQPQNVGFELDSVLVDTTGSGFVSLSKVLFPTSLTLNNFQYNNRVRIVYKQRLGSVINSERHYLRNGQDSTVRDTTGLVVAPVILTRTLALPIDFESTTTDWAYLITNFEGGNLTTAVNPSPSGINTSARVGKMVKGPGGSPAAGAYLTLTNPIDFTNKNTFNIQVRAPRVGVTVLLKIESPTDPTIYFLKTVSTKTANTWENLVFDLTGLNRNWTYQKVVIIFDLDVAIGDGSANYTYYLDNINLVNSTPETPLTTIGLPLDFQLIPDSNYKFTNFEGGVASVVSNPSATGINTSTKVGKMVKGPGGATYGGSWIALTNPIDFTNKNRFYMQVYSPRVGAKVLLKVENLTDGTIFFEATDSTTSANTWELLEFDYSLINKANSYQKIILIFDNGTVGDGSANFTYYFDNISLGNSTPETPLTTIGLPLDFQLVPDSNYKFTNFNGGAVTVVANPSATGINTSTKVGKMVKGPGGATYGGAWIALTNPIDFTNKNRFYMQVYSPRVGAKVLLKVENLTDGTINFETTDSTTTANTWELLEFDYSLINKANSYQKIILIFDNGTVGDGSTNFTYYFDNISLGYVAPTTTLALPIDFQLADSTYKFTDFEGGHATVVPNPLTTGINTSTKCGQMVKGPGGATYGGSYLTLTNPVPLTSKKFTIKILADSGTTLVFKLENGSSSSIFFQRDAIIPAGPKQWRTFTFDFTVAQASSTVDSYQFGMGKYNVIDSTKTYQKVVLVFNNGTVGTGTAAFTFYFDDIQQQ